MARLPACPDCGIDIIDKKQAKKISGRWVCFPCLEKREQIAEDRRELYQLVAGLFFIKHPTGMMMKQIKDFKEDLDSANINIKDNIDKKFNYSNDDIEEDIYQLVGALKDY